ncbi:putative gag protein [Cucumis melo var. makuwa]|uniref:Putative gag protein n=1 Tax=Cucumis melo var. makuwa TaxID=1194695 RepID=A0A5D3BZ45_CUCMM|nr:putative gag protein [Cucumis melo var. makuwa]
MQPRRLKRVHEDRGSRIKLKIPSFSGTTNAKAYLECERKIEHVFDCNTFSDNKKMKLVIAEFIIHARNWYDLKSERRRKEEDPIEMWEVLKDAIRKRAKIREEEEDTMSRFLGGLNREIAYPVRGIPRGVKQKISLWLPREWKPRAPTLKRMKLQKSHGDKNGIIDSEDECHEHDAPFEEESDAHDEEYIEGGSSISLVAR